VNDKGIPFLMELGENQGGKQFGWFHRDESIFIDFSNQVKTW
jgi:hypothetical protein